MSSNLVLLDITHDLAQVRLNRPDKHNAMSFELLDALLGVAAKLKKQPSLRAIILSGDGPSFCAGLDVKSTFGRPAKAAVGFAQLYLPYVNRFQRWSLAWRDIGVPVIAAVHGNCFGAGIQLALGADIRIARADARLSIMESKWGLVPDMGGAVTLRELVRLDVAKELTFTGRIFSGAQALEMGLVTELAEDPIARARALAAEIATRSPDAVAAAKYLLQEAWMADDAAAAAAERRWQRALMGRANQRISVERNLKNSETPFRKRSIG